MKKFLAFIIVLSVLVLTFTACGDDAVTYEDVTYREEGIEFTLPSNMRRSTDPESRFNFSTPEVVFSAQKLDAASIRENGMQIGDNFDAKEYVDIVTASLDRDQLYLTEDAENSKYTFRYTFGESEETEAFYYVVVVGTSGNVWEITMSCYQDVSSEHIASFEIWAKYIKTYNE